MLSGVPGSRLTGSGGLGGGDIDAVGGGADGEICGRLDASTFIVSCTGNRADGKCYQQSSGKPALMFAATIIK